MEILEELNSVYDEIRKIRSVREQTADLAGRMAESGYGDEAKQLARGLGEKLTEIEGQLMQTRNESPRIPSTFPPCWTTRSRIFWATWLHPAHAPRMAPGCALKT